MKTIRSAMMGAATILVAGGYAASQWSYWTGRATVYAKAIDVPSVQLLATALLVGCVALWFFPDQSAEGDAS